MVFTMRTSEILELSNAFYELNIRNSREPHVEVNQELTCKIFIKEQTDSKFQTSCLVYNLRKRDVGNHYHLVSGNLLSFIVSMQKREMVSLTVNFTHQLDWVMRCPDIWSNMILGVSLRIFLMRLILKLVDWVKQIALPNVSGLHPIN